MSPIILKLYIAGHTANSERAITNLRGLCEEALRGEYELTIIDVLERPETASQDGILATPSLILESPLPARRVIGDLSDGEQVLQGLGLKPPSSSENGKMP
ncbi:MAG: circadian clock protein KaiB [Elusimicrobia bacterium RIFCSPLOWO2_12_FULL_59_9]|nr:MAG: circadian clock protein KaiB [Elusimicrobia bacterium RIFCSPLOWO2_12_FULL_59_9]